MKKVISKKTLILLSFLILGVLLLSSCFLNPPVTEGILKGQIMVPEGTTQAKDLAGQALPDATVNIIDLATGAIIATTVTDANGYYRVSVPPGGPYLLEAVKGGVKLEQITCSVEVGIEYDLGTADCVTTAAALIAQAMMDAGDNPADINCDDIIADPHFDDVSSIVCSTIKAGGDPTVSAAILQAVEDFLYPPAPAPTPNPTPPSDAKAITAFDFMALDPDVSFIGLIIEGEKTIALTVPFGTDVTALVPTIVHTGASVSPASGIAQNFTSPVDYTVTAEDSTTAVYTVTVNDKVGCFLGYWVNEDAITPGITKIDIQENNNLLEIHMWGKCHPTDCDWGIETTPVDDADDGVLNIFWYPDFAIRTQEIIYLGGDRLEVYTFTDFYPDDIYGREDYERYDYFIKSN